MQEQQKPIGYMVLAKRPDRYRPGGYEYQPAGGVWPDFDPVDNHRVYCELSAEENPARYSGVEYVIGATTITEGDQ